MSLERKFDNIDMKVYVTQDCNADCGFCIDDLRWKAEPVSDTEYIDNFREALQTYVSNGGRRVLLSGGEPTRLPGRVVKILGETQQYDLDLVAMYTHGATLLRDYNGEPLLKRLAEAGLRKVNVSRHHFDDRKNSQVIRRKGYVFSELADSAQSLGVDIRLNCNLLKDFVGSAEDMVLYLQHAQENGVTDVYFRDLFRLHNRETSFRFANQRKIEFTDEQRVEFEKLVQEFEGSEGVDRVKMFPRHEGQGVSVEYSYNNLRVTVASLELGNENLDDFTYFTFYADGKVYRNMNGPESLVTLASR